MNASENPRFTALSLICNHFARETPQGHHPSRHEELGVNNYSSESVNDFRLVDVILKCETRLGFWGSRSQYGWWPTAFYDASSRLFLEPGFTRRLYLPNIMGS